MKRKARFIKERYFKECNKDLQLVHFHVDYVFHFRPWAQLYNNALNDHATMSTIKCKKVFKECFGRSKFITPKIQKAKGLWNALKGKYNKSKTPENREVYRFVRNHIETMRRKSVLNHFNQLCMNAAGKDFWNLLPRILSGMHS